MTGIVSVQNVRKIYDGGFEALKGANLEIQEGEIIALLGPNGAGKTTLISTICGISSLTSGKITVDDMDIGTDYRKVRAMIGLVPQEIALEPFETVINSVRFSRGLFGKKKNEAYLDEVLKTLSLFDKKTQSTRLRIISKDPTKVKQTPRLHNYMTLSHAVRKLRQFHCAPRFTRHRRLPPSHVGFSRRLPTAWTAASAGTRIVSKWLWQSFS